MKTNCPFDIFRILRKAMSYSAYLPLVLLLLFGGCSKAVPNTGATAASQSSATAASTPAGNACDRKLVTTADAAEILGEPITSENTLAGDAQSCVFTTANFTTLTISLRPGLG